jgi:membrane protein YqaA with SNARE-associated domain
LKALLLKIAVILEAFLMPFGAWGLGTIAFLDSAFLPLPHAIDVWVITLCIRNPASMVLYAAAATLGSATGSSALNF